MPELKATHNFILTVNGRELSLILTALAYFGNRDGVKGAPEAADLRKYLLAAREREAKDWTASLPPAGGEDDG